MRVLWLSGNPAMYKRKSIIDGGWIGTLQNEIVKRNIDLAISFAYSCNELPSKENGVSYYPLYIQRWKKMMFHFFQNRLDSIYTSKILSVIEEYKPDIIHCWGSELAYGLIAKYTKIPVIMHIQGVLTPIKEAYLPANMDYFSILKAVHFNVFTFHQIYLRPYILLKYGSQREKEMFKYIRYFMGRTEWDYEVSKILSPKSSYFYCSEALRTSITSSKKWNFKTRSKLVIVSTSFSPLYKGADVILRTAEVLKKMYADVEWNIYGMDSIKLQERITGIKSQDVNVYCRGKVDSETLSQRLSDADVYVHLSYIDNSPNSVCEAQYIGVPVIATYVGGIPSLLKDGAGILVPANDIYQTAYNIVMLKQGREKAESISVKEINVAESRHDIGVMLDDLISIYKTCS